MNSLIDSPFEGIIASAGCILSTVVMVPLVFIDIICGIVNSYEDDNKNTYSDGNNQHSKNMDINEIMSIMCSNKQQNITPVNRNFKITGVI